MSISPHRNQMFAFRATADFTKRFDDLCERLGFNRSEVCRYALKRFFNDHWNNSTNFKRAREEMF